MLLRFEVTFSHCRRNGEPLSLQQITEAEQYALDVLSTIADAVEMERTGYAACSGIWVFADTMEGHMEQVWSLFQTLITTIDPQLLVLDIVCLDGQCLALVSGSPQE